MDSVLKRSKLLFPLAERVMRVYVGSVGQVQPNSPCPMVEIGKAPIGYRML